MGKEAKQGNSRFRKEHNNYNPYNKLELNKFHQVEAHTHNKYGHQLHKRKRDLERMIQHFKSKGMEVDQAKLDELDQIDGQIGQRKKEYEKSQRKQFFLSSKYKQIMNIEKRKVAKKIREIREQEPENRDLYLEWVKKLNYIKHFPKTLKYISLFPSTPMSEKAIAFQNKIMEDIDIDLKKKKEKLNKFEAEYKKPEKKSSKRDDFFLEEQFEQEGEEKEEEEEEESEVEVEEDGSEQISK